MDRIAVFEDIKHKALLVLNKGAKNLNHGFDKAISLPLVQTSDPISVYKTLSGNSFEM